MSDLPPQPSPLFGPGRPSFDVVLRGYDQSTVDALVDRLRSGGPAVTPQELRGISFEVVLRGYDQAQVDAFIAEAAARLEGGAVDAPDGPPDGVSGGAPDGPGGAEPGETPEFDMAFRGYERTQVQDLIERYLRGDPALTAEDLAEPRLGVVLRGYHRGQVDAYLASAANRLQGR